MVLKMKATAAIVLLSIFCLTIMFHVFILLKIIPYKIVWGGRLKSNADMYKFESVSLALNIIFIIVVLFKVNYLILPFHEIILTVALWVMVALFLLNTVGNLLSKNKLEKIIFTPITLVLLLFTILLAIE